MDFVTFEIAKKLKEKGYPQVEKNTLAMYDEDGCISYLCPTLDANRNYYIFDDFDEDDCVSHTIYQVLKWLREVKRIDAGALWDNRDGKWIGYINEMDMPDLVGEYVLPNTYDAYEQAAIAGIEYVLNNLI